MADCEPGKEFVFKMPDGNVVGMAKNVDELAALVESAPVEAVLYHAQSGHFAPWLSSLKENGIAARLRNLRIKAATIRESLAGIFERRSHG